MSRRSAMSAATISTIPEELRQEIASYLNYDDAWSLKQTSTLFYRVVEIPTIKSFLACPYGPSLGMLEEWEIIPLGYEACYYCHRLLQNEYFSRFQRHLTAARQHSLSFDYATWNSEKHYCLDCGVKKQHYPAGKKIYIGLGDPGCKNEAVVPCKQCRTPVDYHSRDLRLCSNCNGRIQVDEFVFPWNFRPSSSSSSSEPYSKMAVAGDESQSEEVTEPESTFYENAEPGSLLALIGERLLF